ncbi:hypothetical protein CYMTET_24720, partial [Cymbomonas tetramitiformis]
MPSTWNGEKSFASGLLVEIDSEWYVDVDAIFTTSTCPEAGGYDIVYPGTTGLPLIHFSGVEHRGKQYPHGVEKTLIRLQTGVRCFYGDEYGFPNDYVNGADQDFPPGSVLKLGTKGVVEWDSVIGHGKVFMNETEYAEEQQFRSSSVKFLCTHEVITIQGGKAITRALPQSVNEYRVLGRPRNISPAVWHTLLERLGTPKESEHTSKIVVQEPRAGWAAHQNIRGMMLAGGFQGFPFVYHGAANPHNPINKRDRSLINGPITFAFTDVQDYARIKVTWHKT